MGSEGFAALLVTTGSAVVLCACASPCSEGVPGSSAWAPQIVDPAGVGAGGYGTGNAAGVWKLSLTPSAYGTSCVSLDATAATAESYVYTLEFSADHAAHLYLEGVPFASGTYQDQVEGGSAADRLEWRTPSRTELDRPGGRVQYYIEGEGTFTGNVQAAVLTWTGWERIVVTESDDSSIRVGCTYEYTVSGVKVCDE